MRNPAHADSQRTCTFYACCYGQPGSEIREFFDTLDTVRRETILFRDR